MATDDKDPPYAQFSVEFTPLPVHVTGDMTPDQANLAICQSTCEQLRLANAALQAKADEQAEVIRKLHTDRRALAAEVERLRKLIPASK